MSGRNAQGREVREYIAIGDNGGPVLVQAYAPPLVSLGNLPMAGLISTEGNSKASPTVVTFLQPHGLVTGDTVWFSSSDSSPVINGAQVVTVEDSMGIVHGSHGHLAPASEQLRSEPAIVAGMAQATLGVDWRGFVADYDRIRDRIARVIPGFENMNTRVREPGGFALPHAVRDRREFATANGRAQFTVHPIPHLEIAPGQLVMMTIRSHDQFNTTIYGLNDRYRGISNGRRVVLLNPDDIAARGFADGDVVDLVSHFRGVQRRAQQFRIVSYAIPRGCAATYFPETNVLVPIDSVAVGSRTPTSKSVIITLERPTARG